MSFSCFSLNVGDSSHSSTNSRSALLDCFIYLLVFKLITYLFLLKFNISRTLLHWNLNSVLVELKTIFY